MSADILFYSVLMSCCIPIESLSRLATYNIRFVTDFLLKHWKNLSTLHLSRENLGIKTGFEWGGEGYLNFIWLLTYIVLILYFLFFIFVYVFNKRLFIIFEPNIFH